MQITVNGKAEILLEPVTVAEYLAIRQLPGNAVAVEWNETILSPAALDRTALSEGDTLEILRFVGGG